MISTVARLSFPQLIALDQAGNLFIKERGANRVRRLSPAGLLTTVAGSGTAGFSGDGGPATEARILGPGGFAVDAAGNLYFADHNNHRIRKVSPDGLITTVAGSGRDLPTKGVSAGDGGLATEARLNAPLGLALDSSGNLFFTELGDVFGVNRGYRVRKVDPNGIITTVAGGGTEPVKDGAAATAVALGRPRMLAVDGAGNLFIGDGSLNRILKMSPAGILSLVAGTGTAGFSGDGGPATQAQFNAPFPFMAADRAGNLFFADANNNRIRKISADGIITTVAGSGPNFPEPGSFGGDGGPATAARLWSGTGVAIDPAGNLIFGDQGNDRVRKVIEIAAPGLVGGR